jgi:hypothetical protein
MFAFDGSTGDGPVRSLFSGPVDDYGDVAAAIREIEDRRWRPAITLKYDFYLVGSWDKD